MSVSTPTVRFLSARTHSLIRALGPLVAACASARWQDGVNSYVADHPAVAPIALVFLIGALLVEQSRRFLLVTLCFGIGVLALKDAFGGAPIPVQMNHPIIQTALTFAWVAIAGTSLIAGIGLAGHPFAPGPRTAYFLATSAYLVCSGIMGIMRAGDWGSGVVLATGLAALIGVASARRGAIESDEELDDESVFEASQEMRTRAVAAREWHDSGLTTR